MIRRELRALADRQSGYFTTRQAVAAGYAQRHHTYHVGHGNWLSVERGLFRLPDYPDTLESLFVRWSLWAVGAAKNRQVTVSHESALQYYGLSDQQPQEVHLTVPPGQSQKRAQPGCVVHRGELAWSESLPRLGFSLTTPLRTLQDMKPDLLLCGRWAETVRRALERGLIPEQAATELTQMSGELLRAGTWGRQTATIAVGRRAEDRSLAMTGMGTPIRMGGGRQEWRVASRSFTLVEMLVVVAIMGILLSLLLPGLQSAQQMAVQMSCGNQMRQLGQLLSTYAGDNQNYLPHVHGNIVSNDARWFNALTVMGYNRDAGIIKCGAAEPIQRSMELISNTTMFGSGSYGMNIYLWVRSGIAWYHPDYGLYNADGSRYYVKITTARRPSMTPLLGDCFTASNGANWDMLYAGTSYGCTSTISYGALFGERHVGQEFNMLYLDNHIATENGLLLNGKGSAFVP